MLTGPVAAARAVVATGAWVKSKHDMYLLRGSVGASALFSPIRRRIKNKKQKNDCLDFSGSVQNALDFADLRDSSWVLNVWGFGFIEHKRVCQTLLLFIFLKPHYVVLHLAFSVACFRGTTSDEIRLSVEFVTVGFLGICRNSLFNWFPVSWRADEATPERGTPTIERWKTCQLELRPVLLGSPSTVVTRQFIRLPVTGVS